MGEGQSFAASERGQHRREIGAAAKAEPLFQTVKPITFFASFKSFTFRLWDEQQQRLVGYRALREIRRRQKQAARC